MEKKNIFIVGFPKSGNTWLTRLISDVLSSPAASGMGGKETEELASDNNKSIVKKNSNYRFIIRKTHYKPERHFELFPNNTYAIIYIKRDFRDVLISAFFYKYKTNEDEVKLQKLSTILKMPSLKILKYYYNRFRLWFYIDKLSHHWSEGVGSWDNHIDIWNAYLSNNKNIKSSNTTYENLLSGTKEEIIKILKDLQIVLPKENIINKSVTRQSFKNKKKFFEKENQAKRNGIKNKKNIRFLRKGKAGDWGSYLSNSMIKRLYKLKKDKLIKNNYSI